MEHAYAIANVPPLARVVAGKIFCACGHGLHSSYRCEHRDDGDGVPCDCDISYGYLPEDY